MHLTDVYLMAMHLTDVYLMAVHLTSVYLIGVSLADMHLRGMHLMGVAYISTYLYKTILQLHFAQIHVFLWVLIISSKIWWAR